MDTMGAKTEPIRYKNSSNLDTGANIASSMPKMPTAMAVGEGLFWVMPLEKATNQIYKAIIRKRDEVYITKRWKIAGLILKIMPRTLYYKL